MKEDGIGGACRTHGVMRNSYSILVGKPEGKRPLRKPRRRWKDNVRFDLRESGWKGVDRMHLTQDTV
jgi:hypothetical protein